MLQDVGFSLDQTRDGQQSGLVKQPRRQRAAGRPRLRFGVLHLHWKADHGMPCEIRNAQIRTANIHIHRLENVNHSLHQPEANSLSMQEIDSGNEM